MSIRDLAVQAARVKREADVAAAQQEKAEKRDRSLRECRLWFTTNLANPDEIVEGHDYGFREWYVRIDDLWLVWRADAGRYWGATGSNPEPGCRLAGAPDEKGTRRGVGGMYEGIIRSMSTLGVHLQKYGDQT